MHDHDHDTGSEGPVQLDPTQVGGDSGVPKRIGHYRILQTLGEGGMGVVYEAEQLKPVRRVVALKVIKRGMDTDQVVYRFESERQALALMNHAYIARVFDAGATEDGRPYFAMEHVQGIPITEYCDRHRLDTRARMNLFSKVCDGVQHAHQKGIIHRDIKPSNVLVRDVDGKHVPKIIDFGVAKATAQRLTERTFFTEMGQLIGTPEYMSPEQAEMTGLDIDTRTDVYLLGVLLYELLTGALPFASAELREVGFHEFRRRVLEEEPPKPSTRLTGLGKQRKSVAQRRGMEGSALTRQLRGDLDWIVMKALEKDRTRRYPSASELAGDVRRYLHNEPVLASPPSTVYRMRKFVRRHRAGAAFGAVLLALLVGFGVTMKIQRDKVTQQFNRAEAASESANAVSRFLVGLFHAAGPDETRGEELTARDMLRRGAERVDVELHAQPLQRARLVHTLAEVYSALGNHDQARHLAEEALEIRREQLGRKHVDVADSMELLAGVLVQFDEFERARELLESALEIRRELLGTENESYADNLNTLSGVLLYTGREERAREMLEEAVQVWNRTLAPDDPQLGVALANLAGMYRRSGDLGRAQDLLRRALRLRREALGSDHPTVARTMLDLGKLLHARGDLAGARTHYENALVLNQKIHGPDSAEVAWCLVPLSLLSVREGRLVEAEAQHRRAQAIFRATGADDHPTVLFHEAAYLAVRGSGAEALALLRQVYIERGRLSLEELLSNPGFETLRDTAEFHELVDEVRALRNERGRTGAGAG